MEDLISLIVPVYNAEVYLNNFFKLYEQQTYKNIELVLVDDGSTDNTGMLCDEYAKKNKNVQIYHKVNGGPSSARNVGIKKAKGKYLAFADVDDIIYPTYIEYLHKLIKKEDADMSVCGYMKMMENEAHDKYKDVKSKKYHVLNNKQAIYMYCHRKYVNGYSCLKLVKSEIAKNVSFLENIFYGEDFLFVYELLKKCQKIVCGGKIEYIYVQYKNSSTHKKRDNTQRYWDAWEKHLEFMTDVKLYYPKSYSGAVTKCYLLAINNTTRIFDRKRDKLYLKEYYDFIKKYANVVFKDPEEKKINRILGLIGMINTRVTCILCNVFFMIQNKLGVTLKQTS